MYKEYVSRIVKSIIDNPHEWTVDYGRTNVPSTYKHKSKALVQYIGTGVSYIITLNGIDVTPQDDDAFFMALCDLERYHNLKKLESDINWDEL